MGFNTNLTFLNDGLGQLILHPEEFVEGIGRHMRRGGSFGVGDQAGVVHIHSSDHADVTQLIAVGGNLSTRLLCEHVTASHRTREGQVAILEVWAHRLGYRVVETRPASRLRLALDRSPL